MRDVAQYLKAAGYEITSRWISGENPGANIENAQKDAGDLLRADVVVCFTEYPDIGYYTGGRHVELGIAWQAGKKIFLVGPRENIFYHLPEVIQVNDLDDLVYRLKNLQITGVY